MPKRMKNKRHGTYGITLIELMIAILVLAIGTMAVIRTLDHSQHELGGARDRLLAQIVVSNRAAEIRAMGLALGQNLPSRVQQGPFEWQIETRSQATQGGVYEVKIKVSSDGRPGAVLTTYAKVGYQ